MRGQGGREYRRYERIHVPEGKRLECRAVGIVMDGEIAVLSLGGLYIRTHKSPPIGASFGIRMRSITDAVEADCVVRNRHEDGIGVEFVQVRGKHEESLKRIITRLKEWHGASPADREPLPETPVGSSQPE